MEKILFIAIVFWISTIIWNIFVEENYKAKISNIIAITSVTILSIAQLVIDVMEGKNWQITMFFTCIFVGNIARHAINEIEFIEELFEEE